MLKVNSRDNTDLIELQMFMMGKKWKLKFFKHGFRDPQSIEDAFDRRILIGWNKKLVNWSSLV
jgi:hypothetical protein